MRIPALPLTALALAALVAAPAGAQLYKWTDANGRVQYSDKPPPAGQKATQVSKSGVSTVSPGTASSAAAGPKTAAEMEQEYRKRRAEDEEAAKKSEKLAAENRIKQENCNRAKGALAGLEAGGRQVRIDPATGERVFLDDDQIAQEAARARQGVSEWCR